MAEPGAPNLEIFLWERSYPIIIPASGKQQNLLLEAMMLVK